MAAHLDRILEDLPQTDIATSLAGASKEPQGEPRDGHQKGQADTPPAHAQGRAVPPSQPLLVSGLGHRVKTLMTGPFTRGRAAVVASSQGEGVRGAPVLAGWRHGVEARACPGEAGSHDARQLKTYWMWHR